MTMAESYLAESQSLIITLTVSWRHTPELLSSLNCTSPFPCGYSTALLHKHDPAANVLSNITSDSLRFG